MPDVDRVHPKIAYRYQESYKQLCEAHWEVEGIAYHVLRPLKKDLQRYGDGPIQLIQRISPRLERVAREPLFTQWGRLSAEIDELARRIEGNPRAIAFAKRAAKQQMHAIRRGEIPAEVECDVLMEYIMLVYDACFHDRVLLQEPYNGADIDTVAADNEQLRSEVERLAASFARQARRAGGVSSLRRPKVAHRTIELYDNLLRPQEQNGR